MLCRIPAIVVQELEHWQVTVVALQTISAASSGNHFGDRLHDFRSSMSLLEVFVLQLPKIPLAITISSRAPTSKDEPQRKSPLVKDCETTSEYTHTAIR